MESSEKMLRVLENDLTEQITKELQLELERLQRDSHLGVLEISLKQVFKNPVSAIFKALILKGEAWQPYVLNLSGQKLSLNDIQALVHMVAVSPKLMVLDLSECSLGFAQYDNEVDPIYVDLFKSLIATVKNHPGLKVVDFREINFSVEVHASIIEMIKENNRLLQLSLEGNMSISSEMGKGLLVALESNNNLLSLSIDRSGLTYDTDSNDSVAICKKLKSVLLGRCLEFRAKFRSTQPSFDPAFIRQFNVPDSILYFLKERDPKLVMDHTALEKSPLLFIKTEQIRIKPKLGQGAVSPSKPEQPLVKVVKPQKYIPKGVFEQEATVGSNNGIDEKIARACQLELISLHQKGQGAILKLGEELILKNPISVIFSEIVCRPKEWQLRVLDISRSRLTLEDFFALITLVEGSPGLIYLDLHGCQLGFKGHSYDQILVSLFVRLINVIKVHPALRVVGLFNINFSDDQDIIDAFEKLIEENQVLLKLDLGGNKNFGIPMAKAIIAALEQKELLEQNYALLSLSTHGTGLEESEESIRYVSEEREAVRLNLKCRFERRRRDLLQKLESGWAFDLSFIDAINIPVEMYGFLEGLQSSSHYMPIYDLEQNPLSFIKTKQEELKLQRKIKEQSNLQSSPTLLLSDPFHTVAVVDPVTVQAPKKPEKEKSKRIKLSIESSSSGSLSLSFN